MHKQISYQVKNTVAITSTEDASSSESTSDSTERFNGATDAGDTLTRLLSELSVHRSTHRREKLKPMQRVSDNTRISSHTHRRVRLKPICKVSDITRIFRRRDKHGHTGPRAPMTTKYTDRDTDTQSQACDITFQMGKRVDFQTLSSWPRAAPNRRHHACKLQTFEIGTKCHV